MGQPQLTSEQYIESNSSKCPFCLSHNIEGQGLQADADYAWQPVLCLDCGEGWHDVYALIGYEIEK